MSRLRANIRKPVKPLSPMEKLIFAFENNRPLTLTAKEVKYLVERDGGLSEIAVHFDEDSIYHEEFLNDNLHIMRGESRES